MPVVISLCTVHFIEIDLHSLQRGHKKWTSLIFLYVSSPQYTEGEDPDCWNAKSEDLELEIAFIMSYHLWFCCMRTVVFWGFVSELVINNSGHTKTENKRKFPFFGSWKIFPSFKSIFLPFILIFCIFSPSLHQTK